VVSDLEEARTELLIAAVALGNLLQRYGEQHWADWVIRDQQRIQDGDAAGVDHLLAAYGGMGSLTDVVIDPSDGHHIAAEDVSTVNAQLSQLRSRIYGAAMRVKKGGADIRALRLSRPDVRVVRAGLTVSLPGTSTRTATHARYGHPEQAAACAVDCTV
jgi:hypothetical protein